MVRNLLMLIGTGLIGWWLYALYQGEPIPLGDWLPETSISGKPSQVETLRETLQAAYEQVSAPLDEGGAIGHAEIEALLRQCQTGYHDGIYPEEPALAGWRLCRVLQRMATERSTRLQQQERVTHAPVRRLPRPHTLRDRDDSAANATMVVQRNQAWAQYVDQMRPRCESYLAAMD